MGAGPAGNHRAQQSLGDLVGEQVAGDRGEVPVQSVHHNVHHSAGDLVGGQGVGELRVQNGELGPEQVGAQPPLHQRLVMGENGGVAGLAAGGGDGEHHSDGQNLLHRPLPLPEVPQIGLRIRRPQGDGLGRVDHAAAAHGQDQVGPEVQGLLHPLPGLKQTGVGVDAAEGLVGQSRPVQRGQHPGEEPAGLGALSAVDHQDAPSPQLSGLGTGLGLGAGAKDNGGGLIKFKCMHGTEVPPFQN